MADNPESASTGPLWTVAVGVAVIAVMLLTILAPRLFGLEATSWWVTVVIGVTIGVGVVIYGYAKRDVSDIDEASPKH